MYLFALVVFPMGKPQNPFIFQIDLVTKQRIDLIKLRHTGEHKTCVCKCTQNVNLIHLWVII